MKNYMQQPTPIEMETARRHKALMEDKPSNTRFASDRLANDWDPTSFRTKINTDPELANTVFTRVNEQNRGPVPFVPPAPPAPAES